MKKAGMIIGRILRYTCVFYTVATVLLNLFLLASGKQNLVLNPARTLWVLLFCVIAAGMREFRLQRQIPAGIRYPVHYVVLIGAFFICLFLPSGTELKSGSVFVLIVLLSVIYALAIGIGAFVRRSKKRAKTKETAPYVSQYEKGSDRKS